MGNKLREIRKKAGLTQEGLADAIGTSRSQIVKLERGERRLSAPWLQKLSIALKVSQGEILGDILPKAQPVLPLLGSVMGTGKVDTLPPSLIGQRMHLPPGVDEEEGLEAWVMGDHSMANEILPNTLMILGDPRKHFFPVVPGALLMFKKKDQVYLRQFIEGADGAAWLVACPQSPDPSFPVFRFNSGMPRYVKHAGPDTVNISDITGAVMWEHRSRMMSNS